MKLICVTRLFDKKYTNMLSVTLRKLINLNVENAMVKIEDRIVFLTCRATLGLREKFVIKSVCKLSQFRRVNGRNGAISFNVYTPPPID